MTTISRLGRLNAADRGQVGEKAWNLDRLSKAGFPVPDGVVVPGTILLRLVRDAGLEQDLQERLRPGVNNAGVISGRLWTIDFEPVLRPLLDAIEGFAEPLAVRSSSRLEDQVHRSCAGLFASVLGVNRHGLADALRTVWGSGFSPLILALEQEVAPDHLAIIVQEQVAARAAGVCFSRDPRRSDADVVLVEMVAGSAERLLAGAMAGVPCEVPRTGDQLCVPPEGPLSAADLLRIRDDVLAIEALMGGPVDVEFAFSQQEARPVILQARPIVRVHERTVQGIERATGNVEFADIDDLPAASELAGAALAELVARRADKRHYFRTAARQHGIGVSAEWLVRVSGDSDEQVSVGEVIAETVRELTGTQVIELTFASGHTTKVLRQGLDKALEQVRPGDPVHVGEVRIGVVSGYAAIQPDGSLIIEYIPGAAGGLMFGVGPFSVLIVDEHGRRVVEEMRSASSHWELDRSSVRIREVGESRMPQSLRSADIAEIRRITEIMHAEFGEVRVEWLRTEDGLISLWDLSVEAGRPLPRKMDGVVSIGTARGRAVLVSNTDPLEELLSDRSVIPDASFYTAHRGTAATELRAALFADRPADAMSKPIVVTPFPKISLALLLDHVAGFVFDEAATLCHLAIILREAGVPAVVSPGATYAITPGQIIEITDGGWHAVSAS